MESTKTSRSRQKKTKRRPVAKALNALYPALEAWKQRREHPRKFETWTYDDLWRAACAEAEAAEYAKEHPKRERESQREAIAFMLGVPMQDVKLDLEWQQNYLAALEEAGQ